MKEVKKDIMWRVYLIYIFMSLFAIIIILKILHIQWVEGDEWKRRALAQTIDTMKVEAIRGNICASDGSLLATSVPIFDIYWDSQVPTQELFEKNIDSLSYLLANLFKDKTKSQYKEIFLKARRDSSRYCLIKKSFLNDEANQITYEKLRILRKFPLIRLGSARGGVVFEQKEKRVTPYKNLAYRTIGYERKETGLYVGLEGFYSKKLEGIGGIRLRQKIAGGVWKPINDDNEIEPQNGSDVITTIDIDIQDVAEHALMKTLDTNDAAHGCVILMEVKTGHIKAISNLTKTSDGSYKEIYNYAIGECTEPGSTFKLFSLVAALEDGLVNLNDKVNTGRTTYFDRKMKDSHEEGYGKVSLRKAFEVSSNVGISQAIYNAYRKNPQKFIDRLYKMKINVPLKLDIGGEAVPVVKNTKNASWSRVTLPWMSIGYEVALTPLQILTFYNAIANNGKMIRPMFVSEIRRMGKVTDTVKASVISDSVCSIKTAKLAQSLLINVVDSGTAKNIKNSMYKIAGKTGTAQIARNNQGYGNKEAGGVIYKASFVGYFPADNPMYSCIVVINEPRKGKIYGGAISAPVFKEIADRVYARDLSIPQKNDLVKKEVNIPFVKAANQNELFLIYNMLDFKTISKNPSSEWSLVNMDNQTVFLDELSVKYGVVPDVTGMGIKDALYIMESLGLKVKVSGKGKVIRQSLSAGIKASKGAEIILTLSNSSFEILPKPKETVVKAELKKSDTASVGAAKKKENVKPVAKVKKPEVVNKLESKKTVVTKKKTKKTPASSVKMQNNDAVTNKKKTTK